MGHTSGKREKRNLLYDFEIMPGFQTRTLFRSCDSFNVSEIRYSKQNCSYLKPPHSQPKTRASTVKIL